MRFDKKVVMISGASRGIGLASAEQYLNEGASISVCARNKETLKEVFKDIDEDRILITEADISKPEDIEIWFDETLKKFGRLDVLLNNAGTLILKPFAEQSIEDWQQSLNVNVLGTALCCKHAFAAMKDYGGGSIVNISSLAGIRGLEKFPGTSSYAASKAAVVSLTEVLAVEGKAFSIRVNCIAPGAVDTQMLREAAPGLKTNTKPSEIACTILYLSDPASSPKITGSTLEVFSNE